MFWTNETGFFYFDWLFFILKMRVGGNSDFLYINDFEVRLFFSNN